MRCRGLLGLYFSDVNKHTATIYRWVEMQMMAVDSYPVFEPSNRAGVCDGVCLLRRYLDIHILLFQIGALFPAYFCFFHAWSSPPHFRFPNQRNGLHGTNKSWRFVGDMI